MIVGPLEFSQPAWLLLAPAMWVLTVLIARRSLNGLGSRTMIVAIIVRCLVALLIAAALAQPSRRRESKDLSILMVVDESRSMPPGLNDALRQYIEKAVTSAGAGDRVGVITAAEQPFAQTLPTDKTRPADFAAAMNPAEWHTGPREGTDLGAAVRLATAMKPQDTAGRIVLFSDGNETAGSLLSSAAAAKAAGLVIDVLPIPYKVEHEVLFDNLIAPATARMGQTVNLRFVLTATQRTEGTLNLLLDGQSLDLSPEAPGEGKRITLDAGANVIVASVTLDRDGPQRFEAVFEPARQSSDTIVQNNRAEAVTFVGSSGKVLILASDPAAADPLARALREAKIDAEVQPAESAPADVVGWQRYDAVILHDTSASYFSAVQQKQLVSYIHDAGGGMIMVGGPTSFGAGGWLNTLVADALPVKLDPPQKRQMLRGALVLVMHSCEMPQGNYWGQQTALAAAKALSRLDMIGVIEFAWGKANLDGTFWTYPLALVGDGGGVTRAISALQFGDAPDFNALLTQSYNALAQASAGQKHCIIISDGDPQPPAQSLVAQFIQSKITISTVAVFPHQGDFGALSRMQALASATGGKYYAVTSANQLATLPQIFTKEAQIVRRSLIWEGNAFSPTIANAATETMRGITSPLPPITGYVVTAEREGLALTTIKGQEGDPIAAQMQHGLGRTMAFTSDASTRWSSAWTSWPQFRSFWEQQVRWAMKPSGTANVQVITQSEGDRTRLIVTATRDSGDAMNFANFTGRIVQPDLSARDVQLRQTGPGRYEGAFDSGGAGTYMVNLRYDAPSASGVTESGTVEAAVTRPYADELRALKDNAALLRQAAELTGGRVLDGVNPDNTPLFSREGLTMPVARRPIWLAVALAALGMFLVDVGVRRVRIDFIGMARAVRRAFSASARARDARQMDTLRAARGRAQESIARRQTGASAGAKFEAAESYKPAKSPIDALSTTVPGPQAPKPTSPPSAPSPDSGISRLREAKKRARDAMDGSESQQS